MDATKDIEKETVKSTLKMGDLTKRTKLEDDIWESIEWNLRVKLAEVLTWEERDIILSSITDYVNIVLEQSKRDAVEERNVELERAILQIKQILQEEVTRRYSNATPYITTQDIIEYNNITFDSLIELIKWVEGKDLTTQENKVV